MQQNEAFALLEVAVIDTATNSPVTIAPISNPPKAFGPASGPISQVMPKATMIGAKTGSNEGRIISLIADLVSISTALVTL